MNIKYIITTLKELYNLPDREFYNAHCIVCGVEDRIISKAEAITLLEFVKAVCIEDATVAYCTGAINRIKEMREWTI